MAMDPRLTKLLEFGIANTPDENGTSSYEPSETYKSMTEKEKAEFVESILGADQSDAAIMLKSTRNLLDPTSDLETREAAVDSLLYCVDVIDNARDACTLGILEKLADAIVTSKLADVRHGAAWVISTICKDCPAAKNSFDEINALGRVMKALEQDPKHTTKYLSILSAALENHRGIQTKFHNNFGHKVFTDPLSVMPYDKLNDKRMFILSKLLKDKAVGLWEHMKTSSVVNVALGLVTVESGSASDSAPGIESALRLVQTCMSMAPSTENPYRATKVHGLLSNVAKWAQTHGDDFAEVVNLAKDCIETWKHYKKPDEE